MTHDNPHRPGGPQSEPSLCVSFCEAAPPRATVSELAEMLTATCWESGFPHCGRLYAGSYFCENYFCALTDGFHEAMRELCRAHGMGATLVVPIVAQAFLERAEERLFSVLERFDDVYDEVVVNDVAEFLFLNDAIGSKGKRIGMGRLFSKEPRDARYADMMQRVAKPTLSAEALECARALERGSGTGFRVRPLIEFDPVSDVVDVSEVLRAVPTAEVAMHLPHCFATTGRNCSHASIDEPESEKFRLGRGCSQHCLRVAQGCRTAEGAVHVKHGRTYYFPNPACQIAGAGSWRIVYSVTHDTMRVPFEPSWRHAGEFAR